MSVGARVPIVATIITLIIAHGGPGEHKPAKTKIDHLRCVRGEPIPATSRSIKLGVAGDICRHVIMRTRSAKHRP